MEKVELTKVNAAVGTNVHIRGDDTVYTIEVIQWPTGATQGFRLNIMGDVNYHSMDISNAMWPSIVACVETYLNPPKPKVEPGPDGG